jgi:hypothetical protein
MQKENSKKIVWGVVSVLVLVAVFYGGSVYGKGQAASARAAFAGTRTRGTGGLGGVAGGFTTGSIISKDAKSITVSVMSGGSKIIFLDNTTKVTKSASGTLADLVVGTNVSVMGAANSDGSVNATTVQIRPNVPKPTTTQ